MNRNIALLGSTGSIGRNTLDVVRKNRDRFNIIGLACGYNTDLIAEQIKEFNPLVVSVESKEDSKKLKKEFPNKKIFYGRNGVMEVAMANGVNTVFTATSGTYSINATLEAIQTGHRICLANKETMVAAGDLVNKYMSETESEIIPVDSEQSAIFQCINGDQRKYLKKVIITASGGPFFKLDKKKFSTVTVEDAMKHPVWSMGTKITIDSSTLMNKALEIIEAFYLFDLLKDQIEVLIHPQSIIHSLVEYSDNSVLAQLGVPDMKMPILYSLSYPERVNGLSDTLKLAEIGSLEFFKPDFEKFPSLKMAFEVIEKRKNSGLVFNAANEVAVESFIKGELSFNGIFRTVEHMLHRIKSITINSSDEIYPMIEEVKRLTMEYVQKSKFKME